MELKHYLALLRRWVWLILVGALLGSVVGLGYSRLSTRFYRSTLMMQLNQGSDPLRDPYTSMLTSQRLAATSVEQLRSRIVLEQVIGDLGLPYAVKDLTANLSVQAVRDTNLIRIAVEDASPALAQTITNEIAKVFIEKTTLSQQAGFRAAQDDLERQIADVRKKIDETQKMLAPLGNPSDAKILAAPEFVRTDQMRYQLELSTLQGQYGVLLKSLQDYRLAASRYTDPVSVFAPADLNNEPVRPRTSTNTLIGLAVGTLLSLGVAFLIEYLDDSLKSSDDVTRVLELGTLGLVPRFPKGSRNPLVTLDSPRSPHAEAYRNLRGNLQFSFAIGSAATMVVTSAGPGEGKSTTTANLAIAMAEVGKRVLLIDADLRRPTQHHIFDLPAEPGLTNLFLGEQTFDQVIQPTATPGLHLITSGRLPPNPAELIGFEWMDHFIASAQEHYDIVLFDTPPILLVADALLLASKTKHLLWIISAGETRPDALRRAKQAIAQVDAKIMGVVLNRLTSGNGYGYYYKHDYDGTDGKKQKRLPGSSMLNAPTPGKQSAGKSNGTPISLPIPPEQLTSHPTP